MKGQEGLLLRADFRCIDSFTKDLSFSFNGFPRPKTISGHLAQIARKTRFRLECHTNASIKPVKSKFCDLEAESGQNLRLKIFLATALRLDFTDLSRCGHKSQTKPGTSRIRKQPQEGISKCCCQMRTRFS